MDYVTRNVTGQIRGQQPNFFKCTSLKIFEQSKSHLIGTRVHDAIYVSEWPAWPFLTTQEVRCDVRGTCRSSLCAGETF
jgi:hypothetical protein